MKENIAGRVARIVSGSINALVSAVEDMAPENVMEQAIHEVDGAIDELRAELGKVIATRHLALTRLSEAQRAHGELDERIALAVREARDDLAEAAIARQLDVEAQIPVLETALGDGAAEVKELEGYIGALQAKRREMQEALRQFRQSQERAPGTAAVRSGGDVAATVAKAGSTFDRVLERATGLPSTPMAGQEAAKLAELEDLARRDRIRERLAAAKAGAR